MDLFAICQLSPVVPGGPFPVFRPDQMPHRLLLVHGIVFRQGQQVIANQGVKKLLQDWGGKGNFHALRLGV